MSGVWLWLLRMAFVILGRLLVFPIRRGLCSVSHRTHCFFQLQPGSCDSRLRVCYEMLPLPCIRRWKTDVVQLSGKSKSEPWVESQGISTILVTYNGLDEPRTSL